MVHQNHVIQIHFILATNVLAGTSIVNQLTGTPGGVGTYTVTNTQTVNTINFI